MSIVNPGPAQTVRKYPLKILHLNPNSIIAHDGVRIHDIEALNTINNYDVIAVTESALHSSISNEAIQLNGFIPIHKDLPDNITHGGILLYHKVSLAVRERPDLVTSSNMLVREVTINKNKIIISVTYRKHYNSITELDAFMAKYKAMCNLVTVENPICALHLEDLNSRSSQFWRNDVDNDAGNRLVTILNEYGLHQLVHEPTHHMNDCKSCMNLVITDQPNLIKECFMLPPLTNCFHSNRRL